jgi:hypothetical protein
VCSVAPTTTYASQERSQVAKDDFKYLHPYLFNGNNYHRVDFICFRIGGRKQWRENKNKSL